MELLDVLGYKGSSLWQLTSQLKGDFEHQTNIQRLYTATSSLGCL